MSLSRRGLFLSAGAFLAAPAIVRVVSIMPVSVLRWETMHWYNVRAYGPDWTTGMCGYFRNHHEALARLTTLEVPVAVSWDKTTSTRVLL